ncbi:LytTR family DNA-binding domain-containing protein [Fulvivirgaceae bacterium BMA12]|uniref:LytTR family DNA-binding domain-containing protein n=1 Tax=Agaribacillus aureus TaxID=3051825 RepID=A0ABT8L4X2_9BACT|nr:LytTR family DNA-binding domain-containing protein [Fulvivirgaceae bacterium BMA12]
MTINCIIIDDEPLAIELLEEYVVKIPYLRLMESFENSFKALNFLKKNEVDLIFLDIHMPDFSGIDFFKSLQNPPKVIMTTAFEQYAVEGFELNAVDYLLKPFSFNRLLRATDKAYDLMQKRPVGIPEKDQHQGVEDYIFVKSTHNIIKINLCDIEYIEGYKDYLKVFTGEQQPVLTIKSLKSLENVLPHDAFVRIHKSYIVSINKIQSYRKGKVKIRDKYLPIGDSYRSIFNKTVLEGRM